MIRVKDFGVAMLAVSLFFGVQSLVNAATVVDVAFNKNGLVLDDIEVQGINLKPTIENLVMEIKSKVRYPAIARDRMYQGTATVQFSVSKTAGVRDVNVVSSSGHASLDRAAVDAISKIDLSVIPDKAANEELILTVPLGFKLRAS